MLGEPFLNNDAGEMLCYAREKVPDLFISIETNGTRVGPEMQNTLVENRIDYVKFSIDGASQETYTKYRVGGIFKEVYGNMAGLVRTRNAAGADRPRIIWQYILFKWNDSDEEIRKAKRLAKEAGVDQLYWLLTHSPGASERFLPGGDYPAFEGEKQSLNVTIELASKERKAMPRPTPTIDEYDPWK
jgi:MoaA/NifB/PqqE/SkfB family radical SAM enzyme